MSGGFVSATIPIVKSFTMNLAQSAATYDLFTATGGDVFIKSISFYNGTAATGLTSVVAQTNHTTPDILLASVLLAVLTGGKSLTSFVGPITLASTKKAQYTIVGVGSGGSITVNVEYYKGIGDLI